MTDRKFTQSALAVGGLMLALNFVFAAPANVTTWHNDNARSGLNALETVLAPKNISPTNFGKLFQIPTDGKVLAQPLYLSGVSVAGKGVHNVVYIGTEHDSVYACDADDGAVLWKAQLLEAGETPSDDHGCTDIKLPEVGISATPVIQGNTIYVQAMSKDAAGAYHQRLHALDVRSGSAVVPSVIITATYPATTNETAGTTTATFRPHLHFDRAGLALANGKIYTTWTSFCDSGPYVGWIIGYDTSLQPAGVLDLAPHGVAASIWQSGAAPAVDANGDLLLITANGTFEKTPDANGFPDQEDFGGCFLRVANDGSQFLSVSDYFAPFNTVEESSADLDLGSGGTILLPDMKDVEGHTRQLMLGGGKDGHIYVLDRTSMGKFNSTSNSNVYQDVTTAFNHSIFSTPAFFNGVLFYNAVREPVKAFQFTAALIDPVPLAATPTVYGFPGVSPSISANGAADGIVWTAEYNKTTAGVLHAYDAADISHELFNSSQAENARDQYGPGIKFVVPTIANGKVYVPAEQGVAVFGLFDPPRLANISARASIGTGDDVLIGGFIIQGDAPRTMVLRGIGPSLKTDGSAVPGALQDPYLELHDSHGNVILTNDNWRDIGQAQRSELARIGLAPTDNRESAIIAFLAPDTYTVVLRGVGDTAGVGLVELYDISPLPNSTLANLSSRALVQAGDAAMIGGFIVTGIAPQNVLIRAIGPDLASAGVSDSLADPVLRLYDANGGLLAVNDNWKTDEKAITGTGLQPGNDLDAAILARLRAGNYTAVLSGTADTTGVALLETYALK